MPEVTFQNHYKAGHTYTETWATTNLHCPQCGVKRVWCDTSTGDYYVGVQYICTACAFGFHLPEFGEIADDNDLQRLSALRSADQPGAEHE